MCEKGLSVLTSYNAKSLYKFANTLIIVFCGTIIEMYNAMRVSFCLHHSIESNGAIYIPAASVAPFIDKCCPHLELCSTKIKMNKNKKEKLKYETDTNSVRKCKRAEKLAMLMICTSSKLAHTK